MLPTIEEAKQELETASRLNPGPWIGHSLNVGIAARNIAQKVPGLDKNKAYILGMLHDAFLPPDEGRVYLHTGQRRRKGNQRIYLNLSGE